MSINEIITAEETDLTNCEREAIHLPGSIQPHGVLLVLREPHLTILQVSNNTFEFFGIPVEKLIRKNLGELLDNSQMDRLKQCLLTNEDLQTINPLKLLLKTAMGDRVFDGIIHRIDGVLILELEPASSQENNLFLSFYHYIIGAVSKLQETSNLEELCQAIAQSVRKITGFDRVMVYKFNIHEGIDSTLLILGNRFKSSSNRRAIQVIEEYGKLPKVECYAGQLNQVFMNILANAIDAFDESGIRNRESQVLTRLHPTIRIRTYLADKHHVVIRIADNGLGISEKVQRRLFDPFFTTKSASKGTGIGLAISHSVVVEKHGGNLTCLSAPGQGAEFIVELPIKPRLS